MTEELLQTKLYIPPLRPNLVPRPRLIERLNKDLQQGCKLTLISAPAGFGETMLVSEWMEKITLIAERSKVTRVDPRSPLARLRVSGKLNELRATIILALLSDCSRCWGSFP